MKSFKLIMLIISLLALISSCNNNTKSAKVMRLIYIESNNTFIPFDSTVTVINGIDSAIEAGDIINIGGDRYRVVN